MSFPSTPTNGQTVTLNGITYSYNAANTAWKRVTTTVNTTQLNDAYTLATGAYSQSSTAQTTATNAYNQSIVATNTANSVVSTVNSVINPFLLMGG